MERAGEHNSNKLTAEQREHERVGRIGYSTPREPKQCAKTAARARPLPHKHHDTDGRQCEQDVRQGLADEHLVS